MSEMYYEPENLELLLEMPPEMQALLPTTAKEALEYARNWEKLFPGIVGNVVQRRQMSSSATETPAESTSGAPKPEPSVPQG